MNKQKYRELKEKKLCVYCYYKPAAEGKVGCEECNEKLRKRAKETRQWYKERGYCPRCMKNKLFGDEKNCPECLAKAYEVNRKSKENRKVSNHDIYLKDKERLKELNICIGCRKNQRYEDHVYCENCLIKKREQRVKYIQKKKEGYISRSERPYYGLCYFCGEKIDDGKKICQSCSNRIVKNLPAKTDNSKHYWRGMDQLIKKDV